MKMLGWRCDLCCVCIKHLPLTFNRDNLITMYCGLIFLALQFSCCVVSAALHATTSNHTSTTAPQVTTRVPPAILVPPPNDPSRPDGTYSAIKTQTASQTSSDGTTSISRIVGQPTASMTTPQLSMSGCAEDASSTTTLNQQSILPLQTAAPIAENAGCSIAKSVLQYCSAAIVALAMKHWTWVVAEAYNENEDWIRVWRTLLGSAWKVPETEGTFIFRRIFHARSIAWETLSTTRMTSLSCSTNTSEIPFPDATLKSHLSRRMRLPCQTGTDGPTFFLPSPRPHSASPPDPGPSFLSPLLPFFFPGLNVPSAFSSPCCWGFANVRDEGKPAKYWSKSQVLWDFPCALLYFWRSCSSFKGVLRLPSKFVEGNGGHLTSARSVYRPVRGCCLPLRPRKACSLLCILGSLQYFLRPYDQVNAHATGLMPRGVAMKRPDARVVRVELEDCIAQCGNNVRVPSRGVCSWDCKRAVPGRRRRRCEWIRVCGREPTRGAIRTASKYLEMVAM